jgi:hypothetical protein
MTSLNVVQEMLCCNAHPADYIAGHSKIKYKNAVLECLAGWAIKQGIPRYSEQMLFWNAQLARQ